MREIKLVYCRSCDFCVEFPDLFEQHEKHHGAVTTFQCTLCNFGAPSSAYLEEHTRLDHHKKGRQYCPCCTCLFQRKKCAKKKVSQHHQDRNDTPKQEGYKNRNSSHQSYSSRQVPGNQKSSHKQQRGNTEKSIPRIFLCDQCDYSHESTDVLDIHKQHHGMKTDFICSSCNYGTFSKSSLDRHSHNHHLNKNLVRSTQSPNSKPIKKKLHENDPSEKGAVKKLKLDDSSNIFEWVYLCHKCPFWSRETDLDVFHHHQVTGHSEAKSDDYSYVARFMDVRGLKENVKVMRSSVKKSQKKEIKPLEKRKL